MATDFDITNLYQKWIELDRQLKDLRTEVNQLKWYQQHGTNGFVAYSANTRYPGKEEWREEFKEVSDLKSRQQPKKQWVPQWEENLEPTKPAQWPNEPYTDYLKRIGEYNEAMTYEDEFK